MSDTEQITVAGVTFTADEVISAVIKKDGREIHLRENEDPEKKIGY